SGSTSSWSPLYGGGAHLDQEAIQYIHKFYCKDCRMEHEAAERAKAAAAASGDSPASSPEAPQPTSPQATLEEMSLQQSMDKNKESLKRKLMMRRTVNELVDQGIYPPLKTPPAFAEQRKHLERAKTGDLLRHKIQHRPDRQLLVQQHILEDTKIDPSLHERQRLLKRARLADDLNDKLSHRPGPLELVQGNILKSDDKLREALQDGSISFSRTEPDGPLGNIDEDSTSEGVPSPSQGEDSNMSDIGSPPVAPPAPPLPDLITATVQTKRTVPLNTLVSPALTKLSPITTQSFSVTNVGPITSLGSSLSSKNGNYSGNGINKTRQKKPKPKTQPKSKVIKFHEYKGPPNSSRASNNGNSNSVTVSASTNETPYHVLLQQQQLLGPAVAGAVSAQSISSGNVVMTSPVTTSPTTVTVQTDMSNTQMSPQIQTQVIPQIQNTVTPQVQTHIPQPQPMVNTPQQPSASVVQPTTIIHQLPHTQQGQPQVHVQPQILTQQSLPTAQNKPTVTAQNRIINHPAQVQNKTISNTVKNSVVGTVQKPLSNLEEMKVADLKAELKKRNLPVSGSKPQLIERLKPYSDIIISASTGMTSNKNSSEALNTLTRLPVQAVVNVKQQSVLSGEEVVKAQSPPPVSPANLEHLLSNPLSPETMEITSPTVNVNIPNQIKNQTALTAKSMASMTIDSQPPSVASLAPLDSAMDVDTFDLCSAFSPPSVSQPSPTTITFMASTQSPPQQIHFVQSPPAKTQTPEPQTIQEPQQIQFVQSPPTLLNNNDTPTQIQFVHSPPMSQTTEDQLTHEQLLQQQQHKIQELQKQLEESQLRLKLQQMQHHQLQQQQQQLQHLKQQTQLLQQPTSPVNMNVSSDDKVPTVIPQNVSNTGGAKIVHLPAQSVKTVLGSGAQLVTTGTPLTSSGVPAVFVTANTDNNKKVTTKPNLSEFFKNQALHQSINIVKPATTQVGFQQPFIVDVSGTKTVTLTAPINGISQTRTTSLPSSPVEGKSIITRTASNPYFIPLKEPPKYDEAVRSKHLQLSPAKIKSEGNTMTTATTVTKTNPPVKSQAMDDVLEILIRKLPPSAAQEPPPTPRTTGQSTLPSVSVSKSVCSVSPLAVTSTCVSTTSMATSLISSSCSSSTDVSALLNGPVTLITNNCSVKEECVTPPPPVIVTSPQPPPLMDSGTDTDHTDLLDINEMLNQDLSAMDWTSDPTFTSLDLTDTTSMQTDQDIKPGSSKEFLNIPTTEITDTEVHGSEPDLASLGLNDPENSNMQMDVSDWLDVIMPSTGLTPLSATAPVSFPSDPILTPKTQQEVLDLFNFEDPDFNTPTDLQVGINWDKLTETTSST
ncbi:hypothetical protein KUTeg_003324, partial [Tegillarca granosa]